MEREVVEASYTFKYKALSQYRQRYIFSASHNKATILVDFDSAQKRAKKEI